MTRRYHIHLPAIIYIGLAVLVGIAAANRPNNLLVWIFGLMIAVVLASGIFSGAVLMRVRVARLDPRHGRVGEPMTIRYAVTNRARFMPLFSLHIEEFPGGTPDDVSRFIAPVQRWRGDAWVMHVGPGETVHGEAIVWPTRRGRVRFAAVRAWSSFPLGLIRKSITGPQEQYTLIYPRLLALRPSLLSSIAPGGPGGVRLSRRAGPGADYFGMREYKPGDSIRQIAWRRSAVLDQPLTIERTQPSPPRVRVVLNLQRPTEQLRFEPSEAASARELEETAIAIAASLLQLAERQGFEVGLTVLGLAERPTPIRRGHWHVQKLLGSLAALDLDQARVASPPPGAPDAERAGRVVISPDRVDPGIGVPNSATESDPQGREGRSGSSASGAGVGFALDGVLHLTARQAVSLLVSESASQAPRSMKAHSAALAVEKRS